MFDIITDSACDLTPEIAKQLNVELVPFYVSLDGEHYRREGQDISVREFYPVSYTHLTLPTNSRV